MKKSDGPCALVFTPRCPGCGQALLGYGTPKGPRCPLEVVGGTCKAKKKSSRKI